MVEANTITRPLDIEYRLATSEDASALQQLIQEGFRASDTRANWTGDATKALNDTFTISIDAIMKAIKSPESAFVVGCAQSNSLFAIPMMAQHETQEKKQHEQDFIACFCLTRKSPTLCSLSWFVVHPSHQQGGHGRRILTHAEIYVREVWSEVTTLELNALSTRDELIKWYERNGFVRTGRVEGFPREWARGVDVPEGLGFVYLGKSLV